MVRHVSRPAQPSAIPSLPQRAPRGARAAQQPPAKQQENAQYGGPGVDQLTPMVDEGVSPNLGSRPAVLVDSAVTDEELQQNADVAPTVLRFVVEADKEVGINGHRSKLRAGKIVDSLNYDIPKLRVAGVRLRPATPEDGI